MTALVPAELPHLYRERLSVFPTNLSSQANAGSTYSCHQSMCHERRPACNNTCLCALQESGDQTTSSMPRESSATAAQQAASPTLTEAARLVTDHVNRLRERVMQELEVEDRQVLAGAEPWTRLAPAPEMKRLQTGMCCLGANCQAGCLYHHTCVMCWLGGFMVWG